MHWLVPSYSQLIIVCLILLIILLSTLCPGIKKIFLDFKFSLRHFSVSMSIGLLNLLKSISIYLIIFILSYYYYIMLILNDCYLFLSFFNLAQFIFNFKYVYNASSCLFRIKWWTKQIFIVTCKLYWTGQVTYRYSRHNVRKGS